MFFTILGVAVVSFIFTAYIPKYIHFRKFNILSKLNMNDRQSFYNLGIVARLLGVRSQRPTAQNLENLSTLSKNLLEQCNPESKP